MTLFEIYEKYGLSPGSSGFGPRPSFGDFHWGNDLRTPVGVEVSVHEDAILRLSGSYLVGYLDDARTKPLYETIITWEDITRSHNWTVGHCSESFFTPGSKVTKGTVIGKTGNTGNSNGPHAHVEYDRGPFKGSITANHNAGTTVDSLPFILAIGGEDMDTKDIARKLYKQLTGSVPSDAIIQEKADFLNGGDLGRLVDDILRSGNNYYAVDRSVKELYQGVRGKDPEQWLVDEKAQFLAGGGSFAQLVKEVAPEVCSPNQADPTLKAKADKFDQIKHITD